MPTCVHPTDPVLLEEAEGLASEANVFIIGKPQQLHLLDAALQDSYDCDTVLLLLAEKRRVAAKLLHVLTLQ